MEHMVSGNPITEETLRGMDEYKNKTTITRTDKAKVALSRENDARAQTSQYLENLKKEACAGDGVVTLGSILNATGGIITCSVNRDYSGNLNKQSTYPAKIENGQTLYFKHVETSGNGSGSCGAVVYCGENKDHQACDWMLSWSNSTSKGIKVYTEIAEHGHYKPDPEDPTWDHVYEKLMKSGTSCTYEWNGCDSSMTSTHGNDVKTVVVDATVTLVKAKA